MNKFIATLFASSLLVATSAPAFADVILGNWLVENGETATISKCGGSFCIKLKTGTYAGKTIGKLKGGNGEYAGTVTDPADDKEYTGSAKVSGSKMKLKGCALKIFCQTQNWKKL